MPLARAAPFGEGHCHIIPNPPPRPRLASTRPEIPCKWSKTRSMSSPVLHRESSACEGNPNPAETAPIPDP